MIFGVRKERCPLAGRHFWGNPQDGSPLAQLCMIPLFRYFLVRESDSDFIFTIWHKGNPHSGLNVHISGNGKYFESEITCFAKFRRCVVNMYRCEA